METRVKYQVPILAQEHPTARVEIRIRPHTVSVKASALIDLLRDNRERLTDEDLNRILVMAERIFQERKRRLCHIRNRS